MKKLNQMTEAQMSQANGGCLVCALLACAIVSTIGTVALAGTGVFSDKTT